MSCTNHQRDLEDLIKEVELEEQEKKAVERLNIIMRNGNTGEGYPEYSDYLDDTDEE